MLARILIAYPVAAVALAVSIAGELPEQTAPLGDARPPELTVQALEQRTADARVYGSDTRRVIQLLGEVAERHGVVEKEPKPQVFLTDFSASALTFELRYWVDVIKGNAAQVGSDLRQMISGAFAENGIVIAFPQHDIHLDMARPLAVEIVKGQDQNGAENARKLSSVPGSPENLL